LTAVPSMVAALMVAALTVAALTVAALTVAVVSVGSPPGSVRASLRVGGSTFGQPPPRATTSRLVGDTAVRRSGGSRSVTAVNDGLSATLTAPSVGHIGERLSMTLSYADASALGAVGPASISFGDGAKETFAQPQFCRAVPTRVRGSSRFTHRYRRTGEHLVTVTVVANCTVGARVTLSLRVRIVH
jgi:hypothetical protein